MKNPQHWETIKKIKIPERETPIRVLTKPINLNDNFPEYRIYINSNQLEKNIDISETEILISSGTKKAKCYKIVNYYGVEFDAELQEKI